MSNASIDYEVAQNQSRWGISIAELMGSPKFNAMAGSFAGDKGYAEFWLKQFRTRRQLYDNMSSLGFGRYDSSGGQLADSIPTFSNNKGGSYRQYDEYPYKADAYLDGEAPRTNASPYSGSLDNPYRWKPDPGIASPMNQARGLNSQGWPVDVKGGYKEANIRATRGGASGPPPGGYDNTTNEDPSGKMAVSQFANNMGKDSLSSVANMMESTQSPRPQKTRR